MSENRIYHNYPPIGPIIKPVDRQPVQNQSAKSQQAPFNQLLQKELQGVKFSQHALQRLQSRNINLDQTEMAKLNGAVDKAAQKGARESLVIMGNNLALVVSVTNRTVITAIDGANLKDNVFTNIDSAVIV